MLYYVRLEMGVTVYIAICTCHRHSWTKQIIIYFQLTTCFLLMWMFCTYIAECWIFLFCIIMLYWKHNQIDYEWSVTIMRIDYSYEIVQIKVLKVNLYIYISRSCIEYIPGERGVEPEVFMYIPYLMFSYYICIVKVHV